MKALKIVSSINHGTAKNNKTTFDRVVSPYILQDPSTLTEEELGQVLESGKKWLASCESLAIDLAEKGLDIPKHKLVKKVGNRQWDLESKAEEVLFEKFGEEVYDKVLKSPKKMEAIAGNNIIDSLTVRKEMGNKLKLIKEDK